MKTILFFLGLFGYCFAQLPVSGKVIDQNGNPVFAVNVVLKADPSQGTLTDLDGAFQWDKLKKNDTLLVVFPAYQSYQITFSEVLENQPLLIKLKEKALSLEEVQIRARTPIADQFSVIKLKKLDIYLNPVSAADPLRAITSLPSSTNTNESANPSLRGSAAGRTRVVVNGVPIYSPVRNTQINGLGTFSLFNTELLDAQYVFASNPPLTFGNSSGGLVQIETQKELKKNSWQLSMSLASVGFFRNQQLGEKSFLQVYGNYQFSAAFTGIQPNSLGFLKSFGTRDVGLHLRTALNSNWSFSLMSYGIAEDYEVETEVYSYKGLATGDKIRSFHVAGLDWQGKSSGLAIRAGWDGSQSNYAYGNIKSHTKTVQEYASLSYKNFLNRKWTLQVGANYDGYGRSFDDTTSVYFFALDPSSPYQAIDTLARRPLLEGHTYVKFEPSESLHLAAGLRTNVPLGELDPFLSFQFSARQELGNGHSILLSGGRYHSYTVPGFFFRGTELLESNQVAIDYSYEGELSQATFAIFGKKENGLQNDDFFFIRRADIFGLEGSIQQELGRYSRFTLASTYLIHQIRFNVEGDVFKGSRDLPIFLKSGLSINPPKLFSINISYIGRPGTVFTAIDGGNFRNDLNAYEPIFNTEVNAERLPAYHNISVGLSKYKLTSYGSLVAFLSVNNVLNRRNPLAPLYNREYDSLDYAILSLRTFYFGLIWEINGK
ncbi:MAG: carboxypeptidase-like regulatory domain-containing protein [Bacteroidota bacterium]